MNSMKTIKCTTNHVGYDPNRVNCPEKSDLRVSDNFNMKGLSTKVKIGCANHDIEFRFRREGTHTTDYDVYDGHYFHDGDIIARTEYDKLYISNPRYINKSEKLPYPFNFEVDLSSDDEAKIRFLVSSDMHLCGGENGNDEKKAHTRNKEELNALIPHVATLGDIDFYAVCGDLSWDSNSADESMFVDEFYERIKKGASNIKCVCEGWGNHDVRRKYANFTNIQDGIRDRNEEQRKETLPNYRMSDSKAYDNYNHHYHYRWSYDLGNKKKVHFFMLNNVPGYGRINKAGPNNAKDYSVEIDERNPFDSLTFLEEEIRHFGENDYYVLFFHIDFNYETERWWAGNRVDFPRVIKNCKGKYLASFFGHEHSTVGKETLTVKIDNEDFSLTGYRCACSGRAGAAHYILSEISLDANGQPKLTATSYSNTGKEETQLVM